MSIAFVSAVPTEGRNRIVSSFWEPRGFSWRIIRIPVMTEEVLVVPTLLHI